MDIRRELASGKNIYELPIRVTYYARVSTDSDDQATSVVNQVDYFINYINGIDRWILVNGYVDEGISGKEVSKRANFVRMIEDGKKGFFDLVLTKSVSRFARNTIDSIYYTNLLLDMGIGVLFVSDNINTFYGDSEFRLTLMASIAQDELRKLSDSVRFGLKQSIARGVVLGSSNILGYHKDKGRLVIDEGEAVIVRDMYLLFLGGIYSYSKIAKIVNDRYGKRFNSSSVKRILTNYKYKGYYCGRKSEVIDYRKGKRRLFSEEDWILYRDFDRVCPIIDEGVWDRVNEIIRGRKNTYVDYYKNRVYCLVHGLVVSKRKKYRDKNYCYYECKDCFRVSKILLDGIVKERNVNRVVISNRENDMRIDILY